MSGGIFLLDAERVGELSGLIMDFGGDAERVINDVLHNEAGPIIYQHINPLIHSSGRTFRGHHASAKTSDWARYDTDDNLAVTVGTKSKYHYLYFADDGSNTINHVGDQQFFRRGAEDAAPDIFDRCLVSLIDKWKE